MRYTGCILTQNPMASSPKSMSGRASPELIALLDKLAPKEPAVALKKMFGWPACFVNGKLFVGIFREGLTFRLSTSDRAAFLDLDGAADFEPMPGRKMTGFVILAEPLRREQAELERWVACALEYARTLPAKSKAPAKRKKAQL